MEVAKCKLHPDRSAVNPLPLTGLHDILLCQECFDKHSHQIKKKYI